MDTSVKLYLNRLPLVRDAGYTKIEGGVWTHPDRVLSFNVFIYVVSGELEVWEEDTEYIIRAGQTFFLKSSLHHFGEAKTLPGTSVYWVHFYDGCEEETYQPLKESKQMLHATFFFEEDHRYYVELPKLQTIMTPTFFSDQLSLLKETYESLKSNRQFRLNILLLELLFEIHTQSAAGKSPSKKDITVQKILSYLERNLMREFSADEIAGELSMNYSYLSNLFSQKTGSSISHYKNKLKIHKAARLLRETNLNITQISEELRFSSLYYFSRTFKKIIGLAPTEYVKHIYKNDAGNLTE